MAIKTFNVDEEVYKQFSEYCKKQGISMSKRVEHFLKEEIAKIKSRTNSKRDAVEHKEISAEKHTFSRYC